jgi:hypothetical protein
VALLYLEKQTIFDRFLKMNDDRPTDMSRPNTPFGSEIPLDSISARFGDGTKVEKIKSEKKKRGGRRNRDTINQTNDSMNVHNPAAPRYFLLEGRISSGFLHFRAFLFNDVLLLATPDDSEGPYFLAKQVQLWPPGDVSTRCIETETGDHLGFKVVADDGRKVFGGTPKSWPPTPVWVHFIDACLVGKFFVIYYTCVCEHMSK